MGPLHKLYLASPPFMKDWAATLQGWRYKRERYSGRFCEFLDALLHNEQLSPEDYRTMQDAKLAEFVLMCWECVPFYRERMHKLRLWPDDITSVEDLPKLPLLTKEDIRIHGKELINQAVLKRRIRHTQTGGTTGLPVPVYYTAEDRQFDRAAIFRHLSWHGVSLKDKQACFIGRVLVSPDSSKPPFWVHDRSTMRLLCSSYHLSEETIPDYARMLARFAPDCIQGYPSPIYLVARWCVENSFELIRPRVVATTAETLTDEQRASIERAFHCPVADYYSSSEFAAFIGQCGSGCYHHYPEYGIIELLPSEYDHKVQRIICTSFANRTMPLLRFDIGDLMYQTEGKECPCGRTLPVVGQVIGRRGSYIITPAGHMIAAAGLSTIIKGTDAIWGFQLEQVSLTEIIVRIVPRDSYNTQTGNLLLSELHARLGGDVHLRLELVKEIPRTRSGKWPMVISRIRT